MAIEPQPSSVLQEPLAQGPLKQLHAHERFAKRLVRIACHLPRPADFDLPYSLDHHRVVITVGSTMQWQSDTQRCIFSSWKQKAVPSEVIETDTLASHRAEKASEAALRQQLPWQDMMTLQAWIIPRLPAHID